MRRLILLGLLCGGICVAAEPVITSQPDGITLERNDFAEQIRIVLQTVTSQGQPYVTGFRATLHQLGPAPDPGPGPVPPVPPTPPVPPPPPPAPLSETAALIRDLAQKVASPAKVAESQGLAEIFDGAAAKVAAGAIDFSNPTAGVALLAAQLTADVKRVTGANQPAWKAGFDAGFQARIQELWGAGQLATKDQWTAFLRDCAAGLRAVK